MTAKDFCINYIKGRNDETVSRHGLFFAYHAVTGKILPVDRKFMIKVAEGAGRTYQVKGRRGYFCVDAVA